MQTPSSDKTTQTQRREPLRWLAVAALLLAFLSICCVSQVVTYLLAPHNAHSALGLLSKDQAEYKPWGAGPQIPAIVPQVAAAQAAERASGTSIAAQPTSNLASLPTAELAIVPPALNAPTPTLANVLVFQPTPTITPRLVAGGQGRPTSSATSAPRTATPVASDTPLPTSAPTDVPTNTPIPPTPVPTTRPPPTDRPPTNTPEPPSATSEPPSATSEPPTATSVPPPNTLTPTRPPPKPTNTPRPTNTPAPTNTNTPTVLTNTPTDTSGPTITNTPPVATDTPTAPVVTPTPTPGTVKVTKTINPSSGQSPTNVTIRIVVENTSGGPITLTRIDDDMSSLTTFQGATCIGPDGNPCGLPPGRGGLWSWQGSMPMQAGDILVMTITGQFSYFPPIGPGTPTPVPTQYCNPKATATYIYNSTPLTSSSGRACFTLQ